MAIIKELENETEVAKIELEHQITNLEDRIKRAILALDCSFFEDSEAK